MPSPLSELAYRPYACIADLRRYPRAWRILPSFNLAWRPWPVKPVSSINACLLGWGTSEVRAAVGVRYAYPRVSLPR